MPIENNSLKFSTPTGGKKGRNWASEFNGGKLKAGGMIMVAGLDGGESEGGGDWGAEEL